jgi:hypothetical protein
VGKKTLTTPKPFSNPLLVVGKKLLQLQSCLKSLVDCGQKNSYNSKAIFKSLISCRQKKLLQLQSCLKSLVDCRQKNSYNSKAVKNSLLAMGKKTLTTSKLFKKPCKIPCWLWAKKLLQLQSCLKSLVDCGQKNSYNSKAVKNSLLAMGKKLLQLQSCLKSLVGYGQKNSYNSKAV